METPFQPRRQGDLGEFSAIAWLLEHDYPVWMPLGHSPDYDLVTEIDGQLARVQVKTTRRRNKNRFHVMLCTKGGNQSWNGVVKHFSAARCDWLFVLVADGRRWFIPTSEIGGGTAIVLGGPKYAAYEVERGRPFEGSDRVLAATLIGRPAGFPSGQRDETVNLAAQPSQVRILPPP
jgi:hypothetical protein